MNAFILIGSESSKEDFIKKLISENDIPHFNILRFQDELKISEARELKRSVSISSSKNRLIIIEKAPTLEAQNALLKTIEELSEDVFIIFKEEKGLIPTIVSRCRVINLERESKKLETELVNIISDYFDDTEMKSSAAIILVDKILSDPKLEIAEVGVALRSLIFHAIERRSFGQIRKMVPILKAILEKSDLVENNNLNKRLTLERIIMDHFM